MYNAFRMATSAVGHECRKSLPVLKSPPQGSNGRNCRCRERERCSVAASPGSQFPFSCSSRWRSKALERWIAWVYGSDKRAHELAIDLRSERIDIEPLARKKFASVFDAINTRGLNIHLLETGAGEFVAIIVFIKRSGNAADPQQNALANFRLEFRRGLQRLTPAKRPPGFKTRKASRNTLSLSAERLITQLEMITSTELSGSGMCSISPLRNSTLAMPDFFLFSLASASISSVMSRP